MSVITVEHACFSYSRPVLQDVSMEVPAGGVIALLGPNGCGKSTLIKLLLGLYVPGTGSVRLDGKDLWRIPRRELARQIAYVPQVHREGFAYSVGEVVLMGRAAHTPWYLGYGAADRQEALHALENFGIAHLAGCPYTQVSGGERQLTLIARAWAQGARILMMDEPTNALDYGNQVRLLERVATLAQGGFTFLFSTHHPDHALAVADRVVMLRDGRVIAYGPPAEAITGDTLSKLYDTDVQVVTVDGRVNVCVPSFRLRGGEPSHAPFAG